jgi:hypothetical protein
MKHQKKKLFLLWVVIILGLLFPLKYLLIQMEENKIVENYLFENNLTDLDISKETALKVSDQVRKDFNIKESSWVGLNMGERPFLREDVATLLTHKEGVCGEGTRVVVDLLNRLGFDATRVTFYNKRLQAEHTLVSVVIDKQEFFVDTINSLPKINTLLREHNISSDDFDVIHYTDDITDRREFAEVSENKKRDFSKELEYYWIYSYTATPYTKLLSKIGFDVRVFNFDRPSKITSILAERPSLLMVIVTLILYFIFFYLLHNLKFIKNLYEFKKDYV